ncbi:small-conductance mechanosensitive channel [Chitinophaga terrae (ex Kim and Jung 2007)]|uniref:mechanosensitive ion channel family protein n=1 Tax=Chitinophaga terrae (ex Kim and Jung 2007) TaxID=408074 RepID=UPI0027842CA4|nr:mechanosensitive ion channel family protein [Chitinophaga terrae (ex Kim and Jung 2007)]MDQ0106508.1 small-conductance mechanosensitive channel [Chitinophaga terrae (ex Kim and Jung 2007)]
MESNQPVGYLEMIYNKLHGWLDTAVKMLPNLVVAILVFIFFLFIARFIRKITYSFSNRLSEAPAISNLVASIVYLIFLLIGVFIALNVLRLDKAVTSLLAGAGIIGLALGFAFQDLTANFISGIFITFKKPFEVGHVIETNGFTGTVSEIELRSTTMVTDDGLHVIIPNKDVFQKPIINHSLTPMRRIVLSFAIPMNVQLADAERIITDIVKGMKDVQPDKPKTVLFTGIDGVNNKALVRLVCWVSSSMPDAYDRVVHELVTQVVVKLKSASLM